MDNLPLVWLLPAATFLLVIGFVFWSKRKTDAKLEDGHTETTPLARSTPDPRLKPNAKVTDPDGVM